LQSDLKKILGCICLLCGVLFIIITLLVSISAIIINPDKSWVDIIITIDIWFIFFWIIIFIFPAIYLIYASKPSVNMIYNGSALGWFVTITLLTLFFILIITLAGGTIAKASEGKDFITYFYQNFGYCLGLGFLFSFLVICLGLITTKLKH